MRLKRLVSPARLGDACAKEICAAEQLGIDRDGDILKPLKVDIERLRGFVEANIKEELFDMNQPLHII